MTIMSIKTDDFRSWRGRRDLGRFATLPETVGYSLAPPESQRSPFDRVRKHPARLRRAVLRRVRSLSRRLVGSKSMIDRNKTTLKLSEPYKNHWNFQKEQNRCAKLQKRWFKYVEIWKSNFGTCIFWIKNTVWPLDWRQPCSKKRRSLKLIKLLVATL